MGVAQAAYSLERAGPLTAKLLQVTLGNLFCGTMLLKSSDPSFIRKISYLHAT